MNIALKIAVFYELDGGGARRAAHEFARALQNLGHKVELFTVDSEKRPNVAKFFDAVHLYQFTPVVWNGKNWPARLYRDTIELFLLYTLHTKIALDIESGDFDFAFIHPSKFTQAPFLLRLLNIPKIYYCQEPLRIVYDSIFAIPSNLHPVKKVYEQIIRKMRKHIDAQNLSHADGILANSRYTQHNILKAYGLKSKLCHMGVDISTFYPTVQKSIDVLFIGTKNQLEGYSLFQNAIHIMKKKPTTFALIRGENWATNDAQLRDYYSSARTVLCLGYNEPFGLIPLEAMACGAVPVALSEGGYLDSVKDGITGVLVKKNSKDLALTLEKLLSNTKKLEHMRISAIQEMQKSWQWSIETQHIVQEYLTLSHSRPFKKS